MGKMLVIKGADFSINAVAQEGRWTEVSIAPMDVSVLKYYVKESDGVYTQNNGQRAYYCAVEQGKTYKMVFAEDSTYNYVLSRYGFYASLPTSGSISPNHGINTSDGTGSGTRLAVVTVVAPFDGYLIVGHTDTQSELNKVYKELL